ncbi:MAG TPA: LytTR family DNA-binding domain-containing protein [Ohtaekwangia sp.]|nr:LytTR family DNA-binding domain-containing protein [Ohtaekwangia sp.]
MSVKLKCLIVDDEPIARQIVEKYCSHLPELEVVDSCSSALQAKTILTSQPVDLLFLDINMPILDGLAFVKTLKNSPQIIFTTAYKEYAHEAFDVNACDYLLKPFSFERFIVAVDKAKGNIITPDVSILQSDPNRSLFLKSDGRMLSVNLADILYAEAQGNNVKVVTVKNTITTPLTFSAFEGQLPRTQFIRVHRSFIINKSKVKIIEGNRVIMDDIEIPIGSNHREQFLKEIGAK